MQKAEENKLKMQEIEAEVEADADADADADAEFEAEPHVKDLVLDEDENAGERKYISSKEQAGEDSGDVDAVTLEQWLVSEYEGFTAALMAAYNSEVERLKYILSQGGDIETADMDGRNVLHYCSMYGHIECLDAILEVTDEETVARMAAAVDAEGKTALVHACEMGQFDALALLADAAPETMHQVDADGNTPLHIASSWGTLDCLELLLTLGADPEGPVNEYSGASAGHYAYNVDCLRALIEGGADYFGIDYYGRSLLFSACANNRHECAEYLTSIDEGGECLTIQDTRGDTPLHAAACNGYIECVKLLLDSGAVADCPNFENLTPAYLAYCHDFDECVALLGEHGACIEWSDDEDEDDSDDDENDDSGGEEGGKMIWTTLAGKKSKWAVVKGVVMICKWKACRDERADIHSTGIKKQEKRHGIAPTMSLLGGSMEFRKLPEAAHKKGSVPRKRMNEEYILF